MKKKLLLILSVTILFLACAAQAEEEELPTFTSIQDALLNADGNVFIVGNEEYIVLILDMHGRYIRMAVLLDDYAKEIYKASTEEDSNVFNVEAFNDYAYTLPISMTEEITETPMDQDELDGLIGKTIQDLMDDGFSDEMMIDKEELEFPVHIYLDNGFYWYVFEVDDASSGYPSLMTVKSGEFIGLSRAAFEMDMQEQLPDPQ